MNINTRDIVTYTRKVVVVFMATVYRSAREHPFVLGMVFFLLLLYRFLPHLFGFLVSSSPIVVCTALLLGMLLSFGQPNIPEIEEEKTTHDLSAPRVHATANAFVLEKDESFSIERHVENRERVEEVAATEAKFTEQVDHSSGLERGSLLSASNGEEERKPKAAVSTGSPLEVDKNQKHVENMAMHKEEINDRCHLEETEFHEAKLLEDARELSEHAHLATSGQNETKALQVEAHEPAAESPFDSSLVSSWKLIDGHDTSESDSDHAESSSPDASMADIIPMLDELHPLLDSEDPQPVNVPMDDLHSVSSASTEDGESDDGSVREEAGNLVEGEEEEAKEEEEDGAALAVKWTEDDEKNLMVLGTSELERNQRLENLIVTRKARKKLGVEAEKNLIDLDANENVSMMDELSRIPIQIPPISTARRNPFDLPYDSEESVTVPPIPGSAPSVLLPRRNPFDLPYDQADETGGLTGVSHHGFVAAPQREMFFRRHESFALGASFLGEFKQEKHDIKLRPYFVAERTDVEEASYANFQRQLSEKSDSKVSSIPESESVSSVADQDYNDERSEQQLHQESEYDLVSSSTNDAKAVAMEVKSSSEVDSANPLCGNNEISICSSHEIDASTFRGQSRQDVDLCSPITDDVKSDVAEEKYSRPSSSCSSERSEKNFRTKTEEGSADLQQSTGDSSKGSSGSMQSVSGEVKVVNDCHVVEPVYDSSPSAKEKSLSNIASLEEELLYRDKGSFHSTSSLSSETLVETSGIGSPPLLAERNIFSEIGDSIISGTGSMAEMTVSYNGELWVAPANLSSVEENESRSREVEMIREQDVIQVEFTEVDDYDHLTTSTLPESAIEHIICYSSSSSTETDSNQESTVEVDDSTVDMGVNLWFSDHETVVSPHSVVPGTSDYFDSRMTANAQPSLESSTIQTSLDTYIVEHIVEQQAEILPSIPKDISGYSEHEERYKNASASATNDEFTGSPNVEVPTANLSDVERESSLHQESKKVDENNDVKIECGRENGNDSSSNGRDVPSRLVGMGLPILSERTEIDEPDLSNTCSVDSKEEALRKPENGLIEHVHSSGASEAVHDSVKEITRIDDEALLLELDAIGDFHVEELMSNDNGDMALKQVSVGTANELPKLEDKKDERAEGEVIAS